jgi:hypothetical protein
MTRASIILIPFLLLLAACGSADVVSDQPEPTSPAAPSQIMPPTEPPPTATETPLPSATITITPTLTLTPTPPAPIIQVSENTHCRTGPGLTYDSIGVLEVGEKAEVLEQSTIEDYWYISNPDDPDEACWLSGLYAEVIGDVSQLAAYTPMPSPTPVVGFELYLRTFESCGSTFFVVFSVRNAGAEILKSGNIGIVNDETGGKLYGPEFQRFPFAEQITPVCPPGHGNILLPGDTQYIHVPIDPVPHGARARGTIKLCTADYQGGECVIKTIWFFIQ